MNPPINQQKLTEDQRQQLELYYQTQRQLSTLKDIADIVQSISGQLDDKKPLTDMGVLLTDIRQSLASLNAKEAPDAPDYAQPVVAAVTKLEKALSASIKAIDVKPSVTVDAPNVSVSPPDVDLSGVEAGLGALPKAFKEAIKLIPSVTVPETDFQPLLDAWEGISEQLVSIENATRLKPQPGSMKANQSGAWNVGTQTIKGPLVGQTTSATTATQLYGSSIAVTNGVFVQALSTNTVSVFVGDSSVSTATGFELQAGQCIPFTVDNISDLFIVSSGSSPAVCWSIC